MGKPSKEYMSVIGMPKLTRTLSLLEQELFPEAMSMTINRTAERVRTQTATAVAEAMGIRKAGVQKEITIQKARRQSIDLGAILRIKGGALNLIHFGARQVKKGVSAKPWGTRRIFKSAFVVRGKAVMRRAKSGEAPAKRRKSKGVTRDKGGMFTKGSNAGKGGFVGRLPIEPMRGPGIAKTANEDAIAEARGRLVADFLPGEFSRVLEVLVNRRLKVSK